MASIRRIAIAESIIVVATIHAPSVETLELFDQLMVLAKGRVAFHGTLSDAELRCTDIGMPVPAYHNPSDHLLDLVATDFGDDKTNSLEALYAAQAVSNWNHDSSTNLNDSEAGGQEVVQRANRKSFHHHISVVGTLCQRNLLNYSRNLLAYGVRLGMYGGMGFLLATIWIRLGKSDGKINDRLSVHFFSVAFLSFMSVAGKYS